MFIHGSFASVLRGDPVERKAGHRSDLDVYGTQAELDQLVESLQSQDAQVVVSASNIFAGRIRITRRDRVTYRYDPAAIRDIDYEILSDELLDQLANLGDNRETALFGVPAFFVSEATDVVIKRSAQSVNVGTHWKKHQHDIDKYLSKGVKLSVDHRKLEQELEKLRRRQYSTPEAKALIEESHKWNP